MIASRQAQKSESPREAGLLADQARAFMAGLQVGVAHGLRHCKGLQ